MAKMAKAVKSSQALIGKTVNMLGGAQKEIVTCRGAYGYTFADKSTIPAKLVRMYQRQYWEVAEEDFESLKEVEDTEKGYAVYPKGFKFTEKKGKKPAATAPKDNKPKTETKPAHAPKDNKPKLTVVHKTPVAHDRPDYEGKIEIKGFDKKTGQLIRTKLTQFLKEILPENTEVRAVQVQIADNQRRMVISADLAMNTYDEAEAIRQMLECGAITKIALKRMSAEDIRETWEDPDVQALLAVEEEPADEEDSFTTEEDPEDLSDEDDFNTDEEEPADEEPADDLDFNLDDEEPADEEPADDDIDPDFEEPEDLSDDDEEEQTDSVDSVYKHISLSTEDLSHSDNKLVGKHTKAFAKEVGIDEDEFYQGLVLENEDQDQFVYLGMKLNDKQQVTMLLKDLESGSRKRVPLKAASNYMAVAFDHEEEEDEDFND